MRQITIIIFFTLTTLFSSAQKNDKVLLVGRFVSDTLTIKNNPYRSILPSITKSKNKVEIRFISTSFGEETFTILTYNQKWEAKSFYIPFGKDSLFSRSIDQKKDLDTIFSRLVSNNIFSLPDQAIVITDPCTYNPETNELIYSSMGITDGTDYCIEYKVGDCYRRYSYSNPCEYADYFPSVNELRNFANIVSIFSELTKK